MMFNEYKSEIVKLMEASYRNGADAFAESLCEGLDMVDVFCDKKKLTIDQVKKYIIDCRYKLNEK